MDIIHTYKQVLTGNIKRFPYGIWNKKENGITIFRYLIDEYLALSNEEIYKQVNKAFIVEYKLIGMLNLLFDGSPTIALIETFPNRFNIGKLTIPKNFLVPKEEALKAIEPFVKDWNEQEFNDKFCPHVMQDAGIYALYRKLDFSIEAVVEYLWPGRSYNPISTFESHIKNVQNALKDMSDDQILSVASTKEMHNIGLAQPLKYFKGSIYRMLDAAFPNRFYPWDMKSLPSGFWNDPEQYGALVRHLLKDWDDNKIKAEFTGETVLSKAGYRSWHPAGLSSFDLINAAFPNKFKPWELSRVPSGFWENPDNVRSAVLWLEKKLGWDKTKMKSSLHRDIVIKHGLGKLGQKRVKELLEITYK
ncbi:hypothetical protein D3C78_20730 [compost metagenome]